MKICANQFMEQYVPFLFTQWKCVIKENCSLQLWDFFIGKMIATNPYFVLSSLFEKSIAKFAYESSVEGHKRWFECFLIFFRLQVLNVDFNKLDDLPPELGCLHNLQVLSVKGNQVKKLPEQLCHLRLLKKLSLSSNRIQQSPEFLFPMWIHLQHLDLRNNLLHETISFNAIPVS